jgi:hypothetical protein
VRLRAKVATAEFVAITLRLAKFGIPDGISLYRGIIECANLIAAGSVEGFPAHA